MRKTYSADDRLKISVRRALLFFTALTIIFIGLSDHRSSKAANPNGGTLNATAGATLNWAGTKLVGAAANGEPSCTTGDASATNCDVYTLTVNPGNWSGKFIRIRFNWTLLADDYDMVVRRETNNIAGMQGDGATGVAANLDAVIATSGNGTNTQEEVIIAPPDSGETYYIRAVYFVVPNVLTDQYQGSAVVENNANTQPPTATAAQPTFDNYNPPVGFPKRDNSGEPSIGINWNTDNVMTMSRLQPNRTTFNDSTSPSDPNTTSWFAQPIPTVVTGLDPIGFTDPVTGRSIYGELNGNFTNGLISDDDLATYVPNPLIGFSVTSSIDHQTIGGGPPSPNGLIQPISGGYPHMVYYAAQNIAFASVAASQNGGLTFNPAIPAYTLAQCGGLHGHIKVAPNDGTVYLPNKGCNGKSGFAVSTDNGTNWTVRTVPTSTAGNTDPSVGVGAGGRVYFAYAGGDNHPHVAVSDDRGLTWRNDFDFALSPDLLAPLTAAVFMHSVAGDNDRAAVFFLATSSTNPGDPVGDDSGGTEFAGTWYPYIATTYDGGNSWRVTRADNNPLEPGVKNPVQQGVVCTNGTTCPDGTRNLLDFNELAVDSRGRVVAVYADGCGDEHPCSDVPDNSAAATKGNNQGIARMTIIRQRDGLRLFSAFDPGGPAAPSLSPPVQIQDRKGGYQIKWATPADGGSPLTSYRIYRGQHGRREQLIAEVKPGVHSYNDFTGFFKKNNRFGNYYYHVTAVNKFGESPRAAKVFPIGK